jgi:transcriptional antiterminator NusG
MAHNWYVVHTLSGLEGKVKERLENQIALQRASEKISEVLIPTERVSEVRGGKKLISQRKFWPGYVFVKMEFSEETFYMVNETEGVIGFLGSSVPPRPLDDQEMLAVLGQIDDKKEKVKPKVLFEVGQTVKVTDGPFANMTGLVESLDPDKGKIVVRVEVFGRETPVELGYWQVEKS